MDFKYFFNNMKSTSILLYIFNIQKMTLPFYLWIAHVDVVVRL